MPKKILAVDDEASIRKLVSVTLQNRGYEVDTAIRYYGTLRLAPECERLILESAARLLTRLHRS